MRSKAVPFTRDYHPGEGRGLAPADRRHMSHETRRRALPDPGLRRGGNAGDYK